MHVQMIYHVQGDYYEKISPKLHQSSKHALFGAIDIISYQGIFLVFKRKLKLQSFGFLFKTQITTDHLINLSDRQNDMGGS